MRHYIIILSVLFALLFSINSSAQNKKDKIIKSAEKYAIPLDFYDYPILIEERDSGLRYFMIHARLFSSNIFNSLSQEDLEYEKDSLEFYSNGEARLLFNITYDVTYVKEYAIWKAFNDDIGSGLREGRKELNKKKNYYKSLGGGTDPNPYDSLKPLKLDHINFVLNRSYINDNERQLYADSLRMLVKEYDQGLIYSINSLNKECDKLYGGISFDTNKPNYYLVGENWYLNLQMCKSRKEWKEILGQISYWNKMDNILKEDHVYMVSSFKELNKSYPINKYRYIIRYTIGYHTSNSAPSLTGYVQYNFRKVFKPYIYDRLTKTGYPAMISQDYEKAIKKLINKAQSATR